MRDAHDANSEAQRQSLFSGIHVALERKPASYQAALTAVADALNANGPLERCAPVAVACLILRDYLAQLRQHFPAACAEALLEGTLNALGDLIEETQEEDDRTLALLTTTDGQKAN